MNPNNSKLNIENSRFEGCHGNPTVAVIGLGYVGLPLAVTFGKKVTTIGFDLNKPRYLSCLNRWMLPVRCLRKGLQQRGI